MYKYGFDLPHFAMFPLLENPRAMTELRGMYGRYLDTAARHGFGVVIGGLDYRASPDWAALLGYSRESLAEIQLRAIDFLRGVAAPYRGQLPALLYAGIVGPRGDAYETNATITADSFTLDHSTRRLASGSTLRDAVETIDRQTGEDRPAFYGLNCSHPLEFMPAIQPGAWFGRVRCLRPNAAMMDKISLCTLGLLESGDPPMLGQLMGDLARRYPHLDIWDGCCGTWDTHLDAIARNVSTARAH